MGDRGCRGGKEDRIGAERVEWMVDINLLNSVVNSCEDIVESFCCCAKEIVKRDCWVGWEEEDGVGRRTGFKGFSGAGCWEGTG